jgi:pimeloyl-ACP methyl ester carboxylesterase
MRRIILIALAACAVGFICYAVLGGYKLQRLNYIDTPPLSVLAQHPEWTEVPGLREVSFVTVEGARIAGWYAPSRNRAAVLLLHGANADRASVLPELRVLSEAGFGALAYDSPGYGASEGRIQWGRTEVKAMIAGIEWLSRRADVDPQRIGGVGFSMGGLIMVQGAARDQRVRAVAFLSAPIDAVEQARWDRQQLPWGALSDLGAQLAISQYRDPEAAVWAPQDAIARIAPRPVFIAGGNADDDVPLRVTQGTFEHAREPKELWIIPGAGHGHYTEVAPAEFRRRLVDFFSHALLPHDESDRNHHDDADHSQHTKADAVAQSKHHRIVVHLPSSRQQPDSADPIQQQRTHQPERLVVAIQNGRVGAVDVQRNDDDGAITGGDSEIQQ